MSRPMPRFFFSLSQNIKVLNRTKIQCIDISVRSFTNVKLAITTVQFIILVNVQRKAFYEFLALITGHSDRWFDKLRTLTIIPVIWRLSNAKVSENYDIKWKKNTEIVWSRFDGPGCDTFYIESFQFYLSHGMTMCRFLWRHWEPALESRLSIYSFFSLNQNIGYAGCFSQLQPSANGYETVLFLKMLTTCHKNDHIVCLELHECYLLMALQCEM